MWRAACLVAYMLLEQASTLRADQDVLKDVVEKGLDGGVHLGGRELVRLRLDGDR